MDTTPSSTPSSDTVSRIVLSLLRVLTFVFLLIALILIAINKGTEDTTDDGPVEFNFNDFLASDDGPVEFNFNDFLASDDGPEEFKFNDFLAYRYMISTIVIGFAYNLLQMALSIFTFVSGNRLVSSDGGYLFDFFGDKVISYLLLSGSAAGFGVSEDVHKLLKLGGLPYNSFFEMANASASLLLIGFLFTATASVFTSFALPKKA